MEEDELRLIHSFVTDLSDCAIVTFDMDGRVRSWNSGAQELFGYSARAARGMSLSSLIADWTADTGPALLQDVRIWGGCSQLLHLRSGFRRDVAANVIIKALRNGEKQFVGYGLLARAITPDRVGLQNGDASAAVGMVAGKRRKILLVDDDDLARETIENMLISDGHDVLTAANGPDAIAVISSAHDIDLMLTDVVMPNGMSGPMLAQEARKLASDLKVIFISGYLPAALVGQGTLGNNADVLVKPFRARDLAQRVEQMFASS